MTQPENDLAKLQSIEDVDQLEELISRPTPEVIEAMGRLDGDLLLLGACGKIGPTLARMARRAMPGRVSPSKMSIQPGSSRSAPAQKPRPFPVMITTRQSLSKLTAFKASLNGTMTSNAMAFMRSGRLRVICVTWGRGFSTRT